MAAANNFKEVGLVYEGIGFQLKKEIFTHLLCGFNVQFPWSKDQLQLSSSYQLQASVR